MDAVGPAGLYLSKQQTPPRLLGEQDAADFAVTRVMFFGFQHPKTGSKRKNRQRPRDFRMVPGPLPVRKFIRRRGIG